MPEIWLKALGLALLFEGFLPFVAPDRWRVTLQKLGQTDPGRIRGVALGALLLGMALLWA